MQAYFYTSTLFDATCVEPFLFVNKIVIVNFAFLVKMYFIALNLVIGTQIFLVILQQGYRYYIRLKITNSYIISKLLLQLQASS